MTDAYEETPPGFFRSALQSIFGLDTRSLALFRVLLGLLMLADLYDRAYTLADFQTDDGFLTRAVVTDYLRQSPDESQPQLHPALPLPFWSFHLIQGDLFFQQALLVAQAVIVFVFLIGWQTRLFTFLAWLMLISLHVRNPVVLNSGDTLLRTMLFWSLFLPLGARWSVDRLRRIDPLNSYGTCLSVASAALIVQLCLMYWFTGWSKYNEIWLEGQGVENVLQLDLVTRPWARGLLAYPQLLEFLSYATVWLELVGPCIIFIPWKTPWFRGLAIGSFWSFHLGIIACMDVGLFSFISMAAWIPLIPREFWNSALVTRVLSTLLGTSTLLQADSNEVGSGLGSSDEPLWERLRLITQLLVGVMLVYVIAWNLWRTHPEDPAWQRFMPAVLRPLGQSLMLAQEFKMFDRPPASNYWVTYEARLANGDLVDLFSGGSVEPSERPTDLFQRYRDHRWRRLHVNFSLPEFANLRAPLLEYLVRRWNQTHAEEFQVVSCSMRYYWETAPTDNQPGSIASSTWAEFRQTDSSSQEDELSRLFEALENGGSLLP